MNNKKNSYKIYFPDYLLDISTVAECFKDYGSDPRNYILSSLSPAHVKY